MFVGENGVLVSQFFGGSPWISDHILPKPGQVTRGLPGGQLLPESKFKDFKQPEPSLPRCERTDHYTEWINSCKAGKFSNDEVANGYVAMPYRKEWDYKV